ncbi:MAG TPA: hydrogenase maturation protease [Firmicutes bacterium]|nr:hydrogenase maturation protease [Bacillota bacterium]
MRTLLLGIGNDILGDDGVGIYVVREAKKKIGHPDLDIVEGLWGGFTILDIIKGYNKVLIVDGVVDESKPIGEVFWVDLEKLRDHRGFEHSHNIHLPTLLEVGDKMGYEMPDVLRVLGISIAFTQEFGGYDKMSEDVKTAIPYATEKVFEVIREWLCI